MIIFILRVLLLGLCFLTVPIISNDIHETYLVNYKGDAVVKLFNSSGSGTGSNIRFKGKNYILTNRHVCNISKNGYLFSKGTYGMIYHRIVKKDSKHDLCVLTGIKRARTLDLANAYYKQEKVYLIGHPRGDARTLQHGRLLVKRTIDLETINGHICERREILPPLFQFLFRKKFICVTSYSAIQSNVVSFRGNSGSPVVDNFGNIVGVLFAGNPSIEAMSMIVPLEEVKRFINSI